MASLSSRSGDDFMRLGVPDTVIQAILSVTTDIGTTQRSYIKTVRKT